MNLYNSYGIYGIRNKTNGKIYIGKTHMNFGDRRDCHFAALRGGYGVNPHLQKSWNKYGEENFEFIVIQECSDITNDKLNELEVSYIQKYKDLGIAYNISPGGDGGANFGKHLSEVTKRKIGEKNRVNMTGKKLSLETRAKMSAAQSKRFESWTESDRKAWGEKMSKSLVGTKKPNNSISMIGNKNGAIYSESQVREIRRLHEQEDMGYTEISNLIGIPRHTVYQIATYRRWKDVV